MSSLNLAPLWEELVGEPRDVDTSLRKDEERRWSHPQSGVEYVYEYPFRQLDWEGYAQFEGIELIKRGR